MNKKEIYQKVIEYFSYEYFEIERIFLDSLFSVACCAIFN